MGGKHGPQGDECEPGWDSALAAENAALWRFLYAASNPAVSKSQKTGCRMGGKHGPQGDEFEPGWDSTRRARRAMGSALKRHRRLIHYRARSNPTVSKSQKQRPPGPQTLACPLGWDSALAAENAALWRFLTAASNPTGSKRPKQNHPNGDERYAPSCFRVSRGGIRTSLRRGPRARLSGPTGA